MAMVVRGSEREAGTGVPSGMSWLWNHAAPGNTHAMTAGITVDAVKQRELRYFPG